MVLSSAASFCCDPFEAWQAYEAPLKPAAAREPAVRALNRILSHVDPTSATPRNLLAGVPDSGGAPAAFRELPWCREVTAAAVAGGGSGGVPPHRQQPTGYRSPPAVLPRTVAVESALGAVKQSAVDAIDAEAAELDKICMALWNNPGLGYTEEE